MADIKLKNYLGESKPYSGVPKVWLESVDSTEENRILLPFAYGDPVSAEIDPDFSSGNMDVEIPEGKLIAELTIKKPYSLIPDNVAKGVVIAGVVGSMTENEGDSMINDLIDQINGEIISGLIVTFIGADMSVLCEVTVAPGYDCPDPVKNGLISRPQKESSVSTVYSYSGWSLTKYGQADANALRNVTENRTVYAAFTESVREYTVRFYDGETLCKTIKIPYGGSSDYVYEKTGYYFQKWEPQPVNITSDMECYGIWVIASFAADSFSQISKNCREGNAAKFYKVGDERVIYVPYPNAIDGKKGDNIVLRVANIGAEADINGDPMSGMVVITATPLRNTKMAYKTNNDSSDIYAALAYLNSDVYNYSFDVMSMFPDELRRNIRYVKKTVYMHYAHFTNEDTFKFDFDIWPLSITEVFGGGYGGGYELFKSVSNVTSGALDARIMYHPDGNAIPWMLRDPANFSKTYVVQTDGSIKRGNVTEADAYVVFAIFL